MSNDISIASNAGESAVERRWRYVFWAAIVALMVWQSVIAVRGNWYSPKTPDKVEDFTAFYGAGKLALHGQNIYDYKSSGISRRPYLYPPTFAVFPMMPLALLKHNAALIVFTVINNLLLFGLLWMIRDALWRCVPPALVGVPTSGTQHELENSAWRRWLRHPDSGVMLALIVVFRYVISNLKHGNANMFVAFSIGLGLWLLMRYRSALGEMSSGVAVALATAIKVTPGIFGLYMLWTWRRWGMLGGALGLVFFLLIMPGIAMGFPNALDRLRDTQAHMTSAATGEDAEKDPIGHEGGADQKQLEGGMSLRGSWMRYLTPKPMRFTFKDKSVKSYYANFVDLPESTARRICQAAELALFGITIYLTARRVARTDPAGIALSWALIATVMPIISPLTRKAHLCVLLISSAVIIALMQQDRIRGRARTCCIAALAAICFEGVIFSVNFIGKLNSDWLQGVGIGFWMLLALYISIGWSLWQLEPLTAPAETSSNVSLNQ